MKTLEYISQNHIVTTKEISELVNSKNYAAQVVDRYVKKNYLTRIRRGLYVSNYGYFKDKPVNPYEIIYKIDKNSILCLHSSLEISGVAHNQFNSYAFYSKKNIRPFQYESFKFFSICTSDEILSKLKRINESESMLVTSAEQTILDCLSRPWLAGGSEEVLRSLLLFSYVDCEVFESISRSLSVSSKSKLGWLLELNMERWDISSKLISDLRNSLTSGPYYFNYKDNNKMYYDNKWKLYLPFTEEEVKQWII